MMDKEKKQCGIRGKGNAGAGHGLSFKLICQGSSHLKNKMLGKKMLATYFFKVIQNI